VNWQVRSLLNVF